MTKYIAIFAFTIFHLQSSGQCPAGYIEFNSQDEVDNFITDWPNCTELYADININSTSAENPILELTGLSNLEFIESFGITRMGYIDQGNNDIIQGSLTGLENIDSLESLIFYSPLGERIFLETLAPLGGISGKMERFELTRTNVASELPDFNEIDSIGDIDISECGGFTETPLFESLTDVAYFRVGGNSGEYATLEKINIPNLLVDISYPNQTELYPFISINSNLLLTEVIGGENLVKCGTIQINQNDLLQSIPAFENIIEAADVAITSCNASIFQSLPNLEQIESSFTMEFNTSLNNISCYNEINILNIDIGINSSEFVVGGLVTINTDGAEIVNFNSNLISAKLLALNTGSATQINGFEELEEIIYDDDDFAFLIVQPNFEHLPNFESLTHVVGKIRFILQENAPLLDMSGLESLDRVGGIRVNLSQEYNTAFNSFNGLSSLDSINGAIQIQNLSNLTSLNLPELEHLEHLTITNCPLLSETSMESEVSMNQGYLNINYNPLLLTCSESPTICQLISTASNVSMNDNGAGCNDADNVLESCALGIYENIEPSAKLYPNPSTGLTNINWESQHQVDIIQIYDITGRIVETFEIAKSQPVLEFDMSEYSDGLYIVRMSGAIVDLSMQLIKN